MSTETVTMNFDFPIADESRLNRTDAQLLVIDENGDTSYTILDHIDTFLEKDDVLVVNNSAVIPASFQGIHERTGIKVELRLAYSLNESPTEMSHWMAVLFGEGNWRTKTEDRLPAPVLKPGDILSLGQDLKVVIVDFSSISHRLVEIKFLETQADLWYKIYQSGSPIQYSYLHKNLHLWDQQTNFAGPPVSVEPPSASLQFTWELLLRLKDKGIQIVPITHAISISNTGDEFLDHYFTPLPERYWISNEAAAIINHARSNNKRIVAIGTSVTRALETAGMAGNGHIYSGTGQTTLKLDKNHNLKIVDGLVTGMHVPGESHINLLESFINLEVLEPAYQEAVERGFLWHEYGDLSLIFKQKN